MEGFVLRSFEDWIQSGTGTATTYDLGLASITMSSNQPFFRIFVRGGTKEDFEELFRQTNAIKELILDRVQPIQAVHICTPIERQIMSVKREAWTYTLCQQWGNFHNWYHGKVVLAIRLQYPTHSVDTLIDIAELEGMDTTLEDIKKHLLEREEGPSISVFGRSYQFIGLDGFKNRYSIDRHSDWTMFAHDLLVGMKFEIEVDF
jgi:hypothetical protein